jgi:hypothetical protein
MNPSPVGSEARIRFTTQTRQSDRSSLTIEFKLSFLVSLKFEGNFNGVQESSFKWGYIHSVTQRPSLSTSLRSTGVICRDLNS